MSQEHRTILIVDDSPEDRELYRRYLLRYREFSYTIVEATLGQQGLELWQQHHPDAVLLDYRLPDLDGLEFLAQLQPMTQQLAVPVIVVTGQGNEAIAVQVMKAGAQDYLIKGQITPEGLQIAINSVIETVRLRIQVQLQFEQQRLVMEMTQRIRRSLNLEDILQTTVDEVRQFLKCDRVIIFQFSPDWSGRAVVESVGANWMAILSTNISDCCFGENYVEPFKQGLVTAKTDIYNAGISPCHVQLLASFQVRANLVVPILNRDELWGLLIAHHCAAPRKWQSSEIDLLRQLGAQVSIAIQQAALFEQVVQCTAQLREANDRLLETVTQHQQTQLIFEDLYNNAPCGYHSLDAEGNFIRINDTQLNWLGYTRDEILHKKFSDLLTSASKQIFQDNFPRFKQQGWINNLEFEIVSKNGTNRCISLNATVIKDKAGNFVMSRSMLFDISEQQAALRERKRIEEALRESEQRYRTVIKVMAEGIVLQQSDGQIIACNNSAERILGLTAAQMMGRTSVDPRWLAIHEDGTSFPSETHPAIVTLRTGKAQINVVMGVYKPDSRLTWISINSQPLFKSDESKPYAVVASFTDITARKQVQTTLQQQIERERILYAIAQHIRKSLNLDEILNTTVAEIQQFLQTDRVIIYRINPDRSGTVVAESVAEGWKRILNMEIRDSYFIEAQERESYQQGMSKVTPDIYAAGLTAHHLEFLEKLQVRARLIVPILHGDRLWGLLIVHHCRAPREWQSWQGELLQQLATQVANAIQQSELYQQLQVANQQLENLAMVDQLTQIANRRCFDSKLDSVWQYLLREQGFVSLLLCDIDYFKQYNDTYGHAVGDSCLTLIAQALKQSVKRSTDLAARYGGEEFVIILPNTDSNGAVQVAQEIHQAIQQLNIPHAASAVKHHVTLSIGIATVIPTSDMLPLDLIKAADEALYQAKAQGRNRFCINLLSQTVSNVRFCNSS